MSTQSDPLRADSFSETVSPLTLLYELWRQTEFWSDRARVPPLVRLDTASNRVER